MSLRSLRNILLVFFCRKKDFSVSLPTDAVCTRAALGNPLLCSHICTILSKTPLSPYIYTVLLIWPTVDLSPSVAPFAYYTECITFPFLSLCVVLYDRLGVD